jgi:hypothetical protein
VDSTLLAELAKRGVGESGARKILSKFPADHPVLDLLEWGDSEISRQPSKIQNPAGFYIHLLEEHSAPPPTFETSGQRKARREAFLAQQRAHQQQEAAHERAEQEIKAKAETRLTALTADQHRQLEAKVKAELFSQFSFMGQQRDASKIHEGAIRARMLRYLAEQPTDPLVVPQSPQNSAAPTPATARASESGAQSAGEQPKPPAGAEE